MEKKRSISVPCLNHRGVYFIVGLYLACISGLSFYVLFSPREAVSHLLDVPFALFGVASGWAGLGLLGRTLATVHLVPEGIAVTILGRTIRRYPVEQLGLFYLPSFSVSNPAGRLCVSLHSTSELVALREARLSRKKSGPDEVSRKKLRPNWQDWFLKDQLRAAGRKGCLNPFRRDFLWMAHYPELVQLLQTMYPQVPWLNHRRSPDPYYAKWQDPEPSVFCRGCCNAKGRTATAVLARLFVLPFFGVLIWIILDSGAAGGEQLYLLFPSFCLAALFEGIWRLGRFEYDLLHITPEHLRITRKKKELVCLPAHKIRHIYIGKFLVKGGYAHYIAISALQPDTLAERFAARCRFPESRMMIRAFRQVPQGDRLILSWYLERRFGNGGLLPVPDMQVLAHTPAREKALREAYPNAQWHDLRPAECPQSNGEVIS